MLKLANNTTYERGRVERYNVHFVHSEYYSVRLHASIVSAKPWHPEEGG